MFRLLQQMIYVAGIRRVDTNLLLHRKRFVISILKRKKSAENVVPKIELPPPMTETEMNEMLTETIQQIKSNIPPAVALVTAGFSDKYSTIILQPKPEDIDMRAINLFLVNKFYSHINENMTLDELRKKGNDITVSYSVDDIKYIEQMTNGKHDWYWMRFRAGRITATNFLNACRTNISNPSISTVTDICWPEKTVLTSVTTEYGIQHESDALKYFIDEMANEHTNFSVRSSGILATNNYPFFSASPDGIVECDCCGTSLIEIKCPYKLSKGQTKIKDLPKIKNSFLKEDNGEIGLNLNHSYYYQVQMQLALKETTLCYFYIWGPKERQILKIYKNSEFWNHNSKKANLFAKMVIVPELMANYYTNKK